MQFGCITTNYKIINLAECFHSARYIERLINMFTVTVEHIYNGCIKVLQGVSLASIGHAHNLDWTFWKVKEVEFND